MATKELPADELAPEASAGNAVQTDRSLQAAVLAAVGRPPGLFGVVVRPLWGKHFRVNMLVGPEYSSARIAHSYFVTTGDAGSILSTVPSLSRLYG